MNIFLFSQSHGLQKRRSHKRPVAEHSVNTVVGPLHNRILRRLFRIFCVAPKDLQLDHNSNCVLAVPIYGDVYDHPIQRCRSVSRWSGDHFVFHPFDDQVHVLQHGHKIFLQGFELLEQHLSTSTVCRISRKVCTLFVFLCFLLKKKIYNKKMYFRLHNDVENCTRREAGQWCLYCYTC